MNDPHVIFGFAVAGLYLLMIVYYLIWPFRCHKCGTALGNEYYRVNRGNKAERRFCNSCAESVGMSALFGETVKKGG